MKSFFPEQLLEAEALLEKDYDYMHRLMPLSGNRLFDLLEDICDRLEYDGSFLYDENPDKTTILNLTDKIYENIKDQPESSFSLKEFIQTILCDEFLYRRCRYHRKKALFNPPEKD